MTATTTTPGPIATRPRVPRDYGVPQTDDGLLAWESVEERLRETRVFWIATAGPEGQPRVRPVDGLWVDGRLFLGGSPETRWVRDLAANPRVAVHLDGVDDVAILDGEAEALDEGVDPELAEKLAAESNRKFPEYGMKADDYVGKPAGFAIRPRSALAWRSFPTDVTKFRFG
jgi:hypothetical protein